MAMGLPGAGARGVRQCSHWRSLAPHVGQSLCELLVVCPSQLPHLPTDWMNILSPHVSHKSAMAGQASNPTAARSISRFMVSLLMV
jgi:hypothetical protein